MKLKETRLAILFWLFVAGAVCLYAYGQADYGSFDLYYFVASSGDDSNAGTPSLASIPILLRVAMALSLT